MKKMWLFNHFIQEGILFLLLGAVLLAYSVSGHRQSFNKDWAQSPYLFPVLVGGIFVILSLVLIGEGVCREKRGEAPAEPRPVPWKQIGQVGAVLGISLAYYVAMGVLKIPYITFGIFSFSFTVSNFEILTLLFLVGLMLYLGVKRISVLVLIPIGTTLFLSVVFRALLHVLLP